MRNIRLACLTLTLALLYTACRDGSSTINTGDKDEELKYSGKIKLNNDEATIDSISPNGYLKYRRNEKKLVVESSSQGEITYELYDGGKKLTFDDNGKKVLAEAIREMILNGFDAAGRVERLYKKGGSRAILNEVENIKTDHLKSLYFERLLEVDTLSRNDMTEIAKKIGSLLSSDFEKDKLLSKFTNNNLKDHQTAQAYADAVGTIRSDKQKTELLKKMD